MTLLHVDRLTKQFGNALAVDALSFELKEHTATALIGPNGAGKTTTLSMLAGLLSATDGSIKFQKSDRRDVRSLIGFLPQAPKFYPWLSALEFTEMAARISGMEARHAKQEAKKTLEFVGMAEAMTKKTATFSGGMKQRLGLAQAIVHKPKLLLLDEPVAALDPVGRRQVMTLLKEIQQQTTILYSTHILNDAEEMTDQLLFLRQGKLVEQGTLDGVREKYAEPKIVIEFDQIEGARLFKESAPWSMTIEGRKAWLDLSDQAVHMNDIFSSLSAKTYNVRKVERQTASLEEIFMKVVLDS
ncbi:ABC transporter ATP-binding protein [Sporosarcina sp. HYO08]|uniref:ABC transporter ATP-binding protein n=1 Tax=Sporosarcina sp. HYO08 TaxID=1759557 RepID=UPI0007933A23|nr:ABC transporter ATP-binding protein [Sporosarcina sp. HYO08]KXH83773.1 ABC transporter ATP-binding protein [Sporosarcina sp. HYO08]